MRLMTLLPKFPVWAILAPLPPEALSEYAAEFPSTEVIRGSAKHSAIVSSLPGSEGIDQTLAERISAARGRVEIFLVRFREDLEVVWVYKRGHRIREEASDPWELARSLGCPLRQEVVAHPVTHSVCVVFDRTPYQVARALDYDDVPESGAMHIVGCPRGTYFYSDKGNVALFRDDVANATGSRVYLVTARNGGAEFYCSVVEDGKDVGVYEIPVFRSAPLAQLHSIDGKTSPAQIVEALGVPPRVLGFDSDEARHRTPV